MCHACTLPRLCFTPLATTLVACGAAQEAASTTYELAQQITVPDALTATPCGVCPVVDDCTPGGVISPATCVYLDKWLEF